MKLEKNLNNSRVRSSYLETDLNRSLKTAFEYNAKENRENEEAEQHYLVRKEQNIINFYDDGIEKKNHFNERVQNLNKKLDMHNSRDSIDSSKVKVQEKLRSLVKTVKSSAIVKESQQIETSYKYKKRESSLQRMSKPVEIEEEYNRRSLNNINGKQAWYEHRNSNESKQPTVLVNRILKESIKKNRNNQDMPLQKLRMKQKVKLF